MSKYWWYLDNKRRKERHQHTLYFIIKLVHFDYKSKLLMVDMKFVVCITVWIEIFTYDRSKEENLFSVIYNKKYIMGYALNAIYWSC